ncbi:MAG: type I restriction enzyme HsdR N-terminal domain-containing protein [Rhodospirillales bacterium]
MSHLVDHQFSNESEVEQQFLFPLLTEDKYLGIPSRAVRPKDYLRPTALEKDAGRQSGYFPDYSIWLQGYPLLVVEAKAPSVAVETGFREACLYARHLNSRYPTGFNPCLYVLASNGVRLLGGFWDQDQPSFDCGIGDLQVESKLLNDLVQLCGLNTLFRHADALALKIPTQRGVRPFQLAGGQAILNAKMPLNSFAADLSPVLRQYFSSANEENVDEIVKRAYVSTREITEYDRVLEALLRDRISPHRDLPLRFSSIRI